MKKILIDMSSIKTGGGLQLASAFLSALEQILGPADSKSLHLLVTKGMVRYIPESLKSNVLISADNPFMRILQEHFSLRRIFKRLEISTILTFFGPGLPRYPGIKSIVGVAYPIICYDDSQYWKFVPFKEKIKKRIWNSARIQRLRSADHLICETSVMKARLEKILPKKSISISPPPISALAQGLSQLIPEKPTDTLTLLIISGLAYHKNNWRLWDIARNLPQDSRSSFLCTFTRKAFEEHLHSMNIQATKADPAWKRFEFIGSVPPEQIGRCYGRAHALLNISDLESFSNNYIEAWSAGIPIIASDRDFARETCGDSAIYCEPHSIQTAVNAILELENEYDQIQKRAKAAAQQLLLNLPNMPQKTIYLFGLTKEIN